MVGAAVVDEGNGARVDAMPVECRAGHVAASVLRVVDHGEWAAELVELDMAAGATIKDPMSDRARWAVVVWLVGAACSPKTISDSGVAEGELDGGVRLDAGSLDSGVADAGPAVGFDAGEVDSGVVDSGVPDGAVGFDGGRADAGADAGVVDAGLQCGPLQWQSIPCPACGGSLMGGWDPTNFGRQLGLWRFDGGVLITDTPGYVVLDETLAVVSGGSWESDGGGFSEGLSVIRRSAGLSVLLIEYWASQRSVLIQQIDERGNAVGAPSLAPLPPGTTKGLFSQVLVDGPSIGVSMLGALGGQHSSYRFDDDGGWSLLYEGSSLRYYLFSGEYAFVVEWWNGNGQPTSPILTEIAPDGGTRPIDAGWGSVDSATGQFLISNSSGVLVWAPGQTPAPRSFPPLDAGIMIGSWLQGPLSAPLALGVELSTGTETRWVIDWNQATAFDVGERIQSVERWSANTVLVARRSPTPGVILVARICVP